MNEKHFLVLAIAAVLVLGLLSQMEIRSYSKFTVEDGEGRDSCRHYYAECTCFGELRVMESYPPQYDCRGVKTCERVNRTVCSHGASL